MSKGDNFRREAESAELSVNTSFMANVFGLGKQEKFEDAAEKYIKAGNSYKLDNKWLQAADMFKKAAKCHEKADCGNDALNDLVNAANALKKISPREAIPVFLQVVDKYNENGRFGQSAKITQEIADVYEADGNIAEASVYFTKAAELYTNENKPLSAQPCYIKVATMHAKQFQYIQAAEIFERIGRECMQSKLGAFSAKGHFFQALLCYLAAGDNVATVSKMNAFKSVDYNFPSSRECVLIEKLLKVRKTYHYYVMVLTFRVL